MRNDVLNLAFKKVEENRLNKERQRDAIEEKAFNIEEINLAFQNFKELEMEKIKCDAYLKPFEKEKNLSDAKNNYIKALKKYGFSESDFIVSYNCPKCHDSGKVNGKICDCVIKIYKQLILKNKGLNDFTFDDYICKTKTDEQILSFGKSLVEKFPFKKINTIIFSGTTGVGKTVLSQCVANGILENGYSVRFITAFELIQTCLKYHITSMSLRGDLLDQFFDCDLLVIDDLGTEAMLKNVTAEYLLLVLSERNLKGKPIIFTTNLNQEQILSRYGERFFSRLTNKQSSLFKTFEGIDKRLY